MTHKLYITLIAVVFLAIAVVFTTFPRSVYSELEKRELKQFPAFTPDSLWAGTFTSAVSTWFSDSEPYRDHFMTLSMWLKDRQRLLIGADEDNVTFHASTDAQPAATDPDPAAADGDELDADSMAALQLGEYENHVDAEENAKIANAGIIIVGTGNKVRALMAYGGSATGCVGYAQAANHYKEVFPSVNVYCMVIPTAVEYYCPEKARKATRPERPTIQNVYNHLAPGVKAVDVYTPLGQHADEDIFLRTDHHWAPLGAYYAAQEFARVAGVPFRDLSSYERHVVHRYVGSMYGYSKDISVKNAPEDFVYYTPKGVDYTTTYIDYTVDKDFHITHESKPYKGRFFYKFKDGNGGAYCSVMGGDNKLTQVRTGTKNGRRLIILKDSFGNALPGYLFFSFEEVHVVDSRYFLKNMQDYVRDNHITDILFANNIFKAYSSYTYRNYVRFLHQNGQLQNSKPATEGKAPAADSTHKTPAPATTPVAPAAAATKAPDAGTPVAAKTDTLQL